MTTLRTVKEYEVGGDVYEIINITNMYPSSVEYEPGKEDANYCITKNQKVVTVDGTPLYFQQYSPPDGACEEAFCALIKGEHNEQPPTKAQEVMR